MENNIQNKSNLSSVLLGVFLVLSLLFGGFIVYDKLLKKSDEQECPKTECQCEKCENKITECNCPTCSSSNTSFYQNMVKNRKAMTENRLDGIYIVVDKNGNVYYSASKVTNAAGTKGTYKLNGYEADPSGDNSFTGYKLPVSNVIALYLFPRGQASTKDYIFIKSDGTVARLSYSQGDNGSINIEKFEATVSGYKNIVGVVPTGDFDGNGYKLFDINGNVYE